MENPFTYGVVVTGKHFAGRTRELAELKLDMRSGQNVVVISPRRYGKTSLVVQAIEDVKKDGALVAYLDLMRSETKLEFANSLANALYGGLVAPFDRAWRKAGDFFARLSLRPRFTVDDSGKPVVEISAAAAERDVDRMIDELLSLPAAVARDREKRVVVVMDEFQEVVSLDRHLPKAMRAIFQQQPEVSHVFLGSRRHLMTEVFTDVNEPMYKMAKVMTLGPIERDVFAAFLRERFASTATLVFDEAIERLLDLTGCHPHDTQQLAYFAWSRAYLDRRPITDELVDEAFERVLQTEDARFATLWEGLPRGQRLVLKALASEGDKGVYSEAYRLRHGLGAPTTVQKAVAALRQRDLVGTTPDGLAICDRLLAAWVVRYRSGIELKTFPPAADR